MMREGGKVQVFVGPSLPRFLRPRAPNIEYRPPIRRGDLPLLVAQDLDSPIAIVDGEFMQSLAVSPREILAALRQGRIIYGAASMGALRAAELEPYGMRGVGRIFEMYKTGVISAEDEVALLFDRDSDCALTEPLVNVRCAVERAVNARIIPPGLGKELVRVAASIPYWDRTWVRIFDEAPWSSEEQRRYVAARLVECDQKREDAMALLETVLRPVQDHRPFSSCHPSSS